MNLWTDPGKGPARIDLEEFRDYPHFHESFEQYVGLEVPRHVTVTWMPVSLFLLPLDGDPEEEEAFIESVALKIKMGDPVPPVLIDQGELFDGRHRAWAAEKIGLRKVPVVDITKFWKKRPR